MTTPEVSTVNPQSGDLLTGLEAHWNLGEADGLPRADSLGNSDYDLSHNLPTDGTGLLNAAADIENTEARGLAVPAASRGTLNISGDVPMSGSIWYKPETHSGGATKTLMATQKTGDFSWRMYQATSTVTFTFATAAATEDSFTCGAITSGVWYHFAFWYDPAADTWNVRVNDTTTYSKAYAGGIWESNTEFTVGIQGGANGADGLLDEAGMWTKVLSSGDITELYGSGTPPAYGTFSASLLTSLEAYWSLDEAEGERVDSHSNGYNLYPYPLLDAVAGKVGNGLDFDNASDNSVRILNADMDGLVLGDEDFTWQAWVKLDTKTTDRVVLGQWLTGSANRAYQIFYDVGTDRYQFLLAPTGTGASVVTLSADEHGSPATGVWTHIIAWHDATANTMSISINNETADSTAVTGGAYDGSITDFYIGWSAGAGAAGHWDGVINEVAIWKKVLANGERTALYNQSDGLAYSAYGDIAEADFTLLQLWEDYAGAQANAAQHAECYGGGNLGPLLMLSRPACTPDATDYPYIYVADGEGHNGDILQGAYIEQDTAGALLSITSDLQYTKVKGLRFERDATGGAVVEIQGDSSNCEFEDLLIHGDSVSSEFYFLPGSDVNLTGIVIEGCVCLNETNTTTNAAVFAACQSSGGAVETEVAIRNSTFYGAGTGTTGVNAGALGDDATVTVTCENVIVMGYTNCFATLAFAGSPTFDVTINNSMSSDATANDFAGSDNVINETDTDVFLDPANDSYFLKDGSAALAAGKDLSAYLTNDAVGHPHATLWPNGEGSASWVMGAFASYPFVATIGDGKLYTLLQLWEDAVDGGVSPFRWAELYSGSDLGALSAVGMTIDADASNFVNIYVAAGHEHLGDPTAGAYITEASGNGIYNTLNYTRVAGVRIDTTGSGQGLYDTADVGTQWDRIFVHGGSASRAASFGDGFDPAQLTDTVVRNSIFQSDGGEAIVLACKNLGAGTTQDLLLQNCTIYGRNLTTDTGVAWESSGGSPTAMYQNITLENCIIVNFDGACIGEGDAGVNAGMVTTIVCNNCITSDGTGDDFGGSDNQVDVDPATLFVDADNDDFYLADNSPAIEAGKTIAEITTDIAGTVRS